MFQVHEFYINHIIINQIFYVFANNKAGSLKWYAFQIFFKIVGQIIILHQLSISQAYPDRIKRHLTHISVTSSSRAIRVIMGNKSENDNNKNTQSSE